jgi:hypothetical protein
MHIQKRSSQITAFTVIFVSAVIAALCFFIPVAPTVKDPFMAHVRTAFAAVLGILYSGSALWFFGGLKDFRTQLRTAYVLLGAGLIIFTIAWWQLPIFGLFDLWHTAWATGGGVILIFILGAFLIYLAIRQIGKTLSFKPKESSLPLVLGITIVVTILSGIAAKYFVQYELESVEIYIAAVSTTACFFFFGGSLARKIVKNIGAAYKSAIRWQSLFLFVLFFGALHEGITTLFLTIGDPYEDYGIYLWPFIVAGFVILKATYEFRLLTSIVVLDEKSATVMEKPNDRDYIDSIVALEQLASRPKDIEPQLDEMRLVTSEIKSNVPLSDSGKVRLMHVYAQVESYLMNNDPLRKFEQVELRMHITPRFRALLAGNFK